jgi:hypothetical protein
LLTFFVAGFDFEAFVGDFFSLKGFAFTFFSFS